MALTTAQIGRCGELLVQLELLLMEIDSAPLSTDTGIDLVAYSPRTKLPHTIQVKTNLKPKPAGGKGKPALDWWLQSDSPAQLFALVDLSSRRIWIFKKEEIAISAQQESNGKLHIYMYTDTAVTPKDQSRKIMDCHFDRFLLKNQAPEIFGT